MNKIVIAIVVIAVLVGGYFFLGNKNVEEKPVIENTGTETAEEATIPTDELPEEEKGSTVEETARGGEETPKESEEIDTNEEDDETTAPEEDELLVQ
ncbi:MAG: hypothetical protein KAS07_03510 [Candidatus Pacebacteria bacterium]|nr:hypothetical protein [Candidatus Paceibacterota bacterium]